MLLIAVTTNSELNCMVRAGDVQEDKSCDSLGAHYTSLISVCNVQQTCQIEARSRSVLEAFKNAGQILQPFPCGFPMV